VIDWINAAHRFLAGLFFDCMRDKVGVLAITLTAEAPIATHHLKKRTESRPGWILLTWSVVNMS